MKKPFSEQSFAYIIIFPALLLIFGINIIPIGTTLIYSVRDMNMTSLHAGQFMGLHYYISILISGEFWSDFYRTIYFTVITSVIEVVFGLLIALLLNEKFPGVKFLRAIIVIPWAIPTVVNASMWKLIFNGQFGVFNALLLRFHIISSYQTWLGNPSSALNLIVAADVWKMTPLAVIFFLAALQNTNRSTYEAAMVDGANVFKRLSVLTLPYLKPTILTVLILRTASLFNAFDTFYIMTRGGPANSTKTLMYEAYLSAFFNLNFSDAATYSFLIALIGVLMAILYMRLFRKEDDEVG
jgi:multiple sugar transport system permease protein/N,N'-diacetylchitobiose transport system permease protein